MPDMRDPEQQPLVEKQPFLIRTVGPADGDAMEIIERYSIRNLFGATRNEQQPYSFKKHLKNVLKLGDSGLFYLVAEVRPEATFFSSDNLAHEAKSQTGTAISTVCSISDETRGSLPNGLLGYATVSPYRAPSADLPGCFKRTAKLSATTFGEPVLGAGLQHAVVSALLDAAVSKCANTYRMAVTMIPFKENEPTLKRTLDIFVGTGFRHVGTLEDVIEKDDGLLDQAILQRTIKETT